MVVNGHVQGFLLKKFSFQFCDLRNLVNFSPEKRKISQIFNRKIKIKFQKLPNVFLAEKITKVFP